MSIAEQMGVALQNTAYSVNIKERLDFSCAVFDGDGSLVANAPHMPVHLGSMDSAVETIIRENAGNIRPGDVYAINAPYNGGTHLPDITVCTPVFDGRKFCSGSPRAAITPTSAASRPARCRPTPRPSSRKASIWTISSWSSAAASARRSLNALLTGAKYPARNPLQNVNDMKAQIAANEKGVQELRKVVRTSRCPSPRPTCTTCRTTRPKACAASSTGCTTARSATRWTRAPSSRCASRSTRRSARRRSISPAPRRSSRPTSTRRRR